MTKQEFIIDTLLPYFKDPSICGYNEMTYACQYQTMDGRHCALGKWVRDEKMKSVVICGNAEDVFLYHSQSEILKSEAIGILNTHEWMIVQSIHDNLAVKNNRPIIENLKLLKALGIDVTLLEVEQSRLLEQNYFTVKF